ncbi:MAG: M20/M25/M40 family metallo-hydrolase [Candidatus Bathyarchaeota archaeon]|nr:M20/M25/M40 family metallo-hydrolase [Candidatus Bathyarchaeota archaeon]
MLSKELLEVEREIIGEIWQSPEMRTNHYYMADELGSRFAGTESEKKAQEYMVAKLKEYGYENARAEPFIYFGWERGPATLEALEPYRREFPVISLAVSPRGEVEAEVMDLGTGSPEEFEAVDPAAVEGKIVLCSSATSPTGKRIHRRTKYGHAVEYGAVSFIFMNHNPGQLPPTGSLRPAYRMGGEIPGVGISLEMGSLMRRLAKGKPLRVRIGNESRVIPETESANIIADLQGSTRKGEWIVVGGHYDGHDIAQGAMDNLSGTVATLELARVLKNYEGKFKRSIRFICFACEEIGVTGSTCYVDLHKDEMKNTAVMVNLELGGLANKDGTQHAAFNVFQPPGLKAMLEKFSEEIGYPMTISTGTSAASDHWPFYMQGVPTVTMGSEPSPQQLIVGRGWGHTTADMMDKVDPRNMQEGVMVLARLILRIADQEEKIAEHTPLEDIIAHLEKTKMKRTLEVEKKWHPHSVR